VKENVLSRLEVEMEHNNDKENKYENSELVLMTYLTISGPREVIIGDISLSESMKGWSDF
jgi:hypothetical protein